MVNAQCRGWWSVGRRRRGGGGEVVDVRNSKEPTLVLRLKQDPGSREWSVLEDLTPPDHLHVHLHLHLDSDNPKRCLNITGTRMRRLLQGGKRGGLCSSYAALR